MVGCKGNQQPTLMHRHYKKYSGPHHSKGADMAAHAGYEALLASIPTVVLLTIKDTVRSTVEQTLLSAAAKGQQIASEAVDTTAGKIRMTSPVVLGAVIIGAAIIHGAWRGKRKNEERTFAEQEEERRTQQACAAIVRVV